MAIDRFDEKILALLVEDARQSVSDISRKVNLSRSAVTERIKRLEESRVIEGYHARLGVDASHTVMAYFSLTFRPMVREMVEPYIRSIPEIRFAHYISGDVDIIMLVETETMARLTALRVEMDSWPNIEKIMTHMCLADAGVSKQ
ncbi:Lrp/AsnC family transcriptional regulator [Rhodanobacter aciditrophus]|uniref:Lrp/AsnC family transcriptional regulator n=1 Tax=Rhodanobacter aciditrophus TaxID=1623218 RepID=A0ABW4B1S3_9GAMM